MEIVKAEHVRRYSHSMVALYRACPLRFKFHYQDKLEPIQPANRHDLDFGAAWDDGLTKWYRDGDASAALDAFAAAYPRANYPATLPVNGQGKTFDNGLTALAAYITRWADDDAHWTVLHVNEKQTSDDGERTLKLDLVVRDDRDGLVYGIDSKTTASYLDGKYWSRYEPNSQVRMYTDHINEKFGHCGGFIINAASFKHRSRAYTPRTGPDKGTQLPAGDWFNFARMTYNPNANAIALERDNVDYWVARIKADELSGSWGYNDQSCHQYGRECEYYKLCSSGYSYPEDKELVLNDYRQMCPRVLTEGRCQLDLGHKGEHDATVIVAPTEDFNIEEDEVENAICD